MGLDPQEGLAKSYKIGDVENRVWCELVKLHTIDEKKSTKELMGRERKSVQKKIKEHHPKATRGLGDAISARESDLIVGGDEAVGLGFLQILLLELRGHPAGRGVHSLPLGHLVLLSQMLHVHLRFVHGGCAGGQRCAEIAIMVVAAEAMNW
jgi:hypothetical protein